MAVTLHPAGHAHARSLIAAGKIDETSSWSFDASDENALLGDPPNWTDYGKWFLGEDSAENADTKGHWKYPFGKDGKLYRAALRAIASRASQQGDSDISSSASDLIKEIDAKNAKDLLASRPRAQTRRPVVDAPKPWYRIVAQASGETAPTAADIYLYEDIGQGFWSDGITAKAFIDDLKALPASVATLHVHINSAGGDVFDAIAIANALRQHPAAKDVVIEGLCASSATIVSSAGDTIRMADNALMMVHNPYTLAMSDAAGLRQTADVLDRVKGAIVATYQWVSSLPAAALSALMDANTWMTADEAIANGLATEKVSGLKAAARLETIVLDAASVPDDYRARVESFLAPRTGNAPSAPNAAAPAADVLRLCKEAGCSLEFADRLVASGAPLEDVRAQITRAKDITALCVKAKLQDRAPLYLKSGLSIADIKADLTTLTAQLDRTEIDGSLLPDRGGRAQVAASWDKVFARQKALH
jgi:ATP-dependent protease ClpP protease subunit